MSHVILSLGFITQAWVDGYRDGLNGIVNTEQQGTQYEQGYRKALRVKTQA